MTPVDRNGHIAWCKQRALEELEAPDKEERDAVADALASLMSDLQKHPETAGHLGIMLGMNLLIAGHLKTRRKMRDHIEGHN